MGKLIQGGTIDPDGDLTSASKVLFRQLFETWRMSDMTLTAKLKVRQLGQPQRSFSDDACSRPCTSAYFQDISLNTEN